MTKIWRIKVRGYYPVPYKIQGGKMTKNEHFRPIFSKVLVSQCPNLPKSQILSSSTCFSKFHVQKCSNFENLSQKWSKKPIFHKNAFFSKSLKMDVLLQELMGEGFILLTRGYGFMGGVYHPPFDTLEIGTSTNDIKLKLYRQ